MDQWRGKNSSSVSRLAFGLRLQSNTIRSGVAEDPLHSMVGNVVIMHVRW